MEPDQFIELLTSRPCFSDLNLLPTHEKRLRALIDWARGQYPTITAENTTSSDVLAELRSKLRVYLPLAIYWQSAEDVPRLPVHQARSYWEQVITELAELSGPERFQAMQSSGEYQIWLGRLLDWAAELSRQLDQYGALDQDKNSVGTELLNCSIQLGTFPRHANDATPMLLDASTILEETFNNAKATATLTAEAFFETKIDSLIASAMSTVGSPERFSIAKAKGLDRIWTPNIKESAKQYYFRNLQVGSDLEEATAGLAAILEWGFANIPNHVSPQISRLHAQSGPNYLDVLSLDGQTVVLNTIPKSGTNFFLLLLCNYLVALAHPSLYPVTYDDVQSQFNPDLENLLLGRSILQDPAMEQHRYSIWKDFKYRNIKYSHAFSFLRFTTSPVIFLYRNPLDWLVSLFHFNREKWGKARRPYDISSTHIPLFVDQYVAMMALSQGHRILPLSYENLVTDPRAALSTVLGWLGIPIRHDAISLAMTASSKSAVRSMEKQRGRAIHNANGESFVRNGQIGQWKEELTETEVLAIEQQLLNLGVSLRSFQLVEPGSSCEWLGVQT